MCLFAQCLRVLLREKHVFLLGLDTGKALRHACFFWLTACESGWGVVIRTCFGIEIGLNNNGCAMV
jgi:hypothetical protein